MNSSELRKLCEAYVKRNSLPSLDCWYRQVPVARWVESFPSLRNSNRSHYIEQRHRHEKLLEVENIWIFSRSSSLHSIFFSSHGKCKMYRREEEKCINKHDLRRGVLWYHLDDIPFSAREFRCFSPLVPLDPTQIYVIKRNEFLHNQYYVQQFFFLHLALPSRPLLLISVSSTCAINPRSEAFQLHKFLRILFRWCYQFVMFRTPRAMLVISKFSSSAPLTVTLCSVKSSCSRWTLNI